MTTATSGLIIRSGPAILSALREHGSPADAETFAAELRDALRAAEATLDTADADAVLDRWHALATMAANPLSLDERAQLDRARAGDLAGLRAGDEHGNWITL